MLFFMSVIALSAVTSAATMYIATKSDNEATAPRSIIDSESAFEQNPVTDAHFASQVVATEYPDLTYAAENAVKAVVNIEATVSVAGRGLERDPFFEFFGYPQGYGSAPRERRAGGSGVIISEDGYIVTMS